jgi:hypothetical protein
MAILHHNGMLSGRVGDRIFRIRNGKNYVARAPVKGRKATPMQRRQQVKFAAVVAFAQRFKQPVALGYASLKGYAYACFSKHLHHIVYHENELWQFDPAQLQLSKGNLQYPCVAAGFVQQELKLT